MTNLVVRRLSALAIATSSLSLMAPVVEAQISVGVSTPIVSNAGTLAIYPEIGGEIPIGTALIRIPEATGR